MDGWMDGWMDGCIYYNNMNGTMIDLERRNV